ncbi:MAG: hypothetical protein AAF940_14175 [Pseudomonadota bacterium]
MTANTRQFSALFLMAVFILLPFAAFAQDNRIHLTHPDAVDGATLKDGKGTLFRVYAIAPPGMARDCVNDAGQVDCAEHARSVLERYAASFLTCTIMGTYEESLALRCRDYQGRDIGARMVLSGWAVPDRRIGHQYIFEELEAEARGNGIWQRRVSLVK